MTVRYIRLALIAVNFWVSQASPSCAQTCADAIRVPYRAQACDGQSAQGAIGISQREVHAHAIAIPYLIHSAEKPSRVDLKLVVTPSGTVEYATPLSGNPEWYEQATALAMTWRFLPFQRNGSAIYARFLWVVHIVPPEKRPGQFTPFPDIKDWDSLRITLQRTACRGGCPAYKLTILGDGRVLYAGATFVDYCGEYRGRVSPEAIRQLVDLFRSADYFNLFDRYGKAFDTSDFITSISFDGNSKSVVDDMGYYNGMPEIVKSIEDGIDRLAGPNVWANQIETHIECWGQAPITTSDLLSRIE